MKKILKIKNKNLLIESDSDYLEDTKELFFGTAQDIIKFAVQSFKFWGNTANVLAQSSYYTFRAKVLKNMSQKDFDQAIRDARINFINTTNINVSKIDNNIKSMLSKAGVSENELDAFLGAGIPGFNILEKLDITALLTGQKFNKSRYSKIDPVKHSVQNLLIFYMIDNVNPEEKKSSYNDSTISTCITNNSEIVGKMRIRLTALLKSKFPNHNIIKKFELIKNKKSKKIFDQINVSSNRQFLPSSIDSYDKAEKFLEKLKINLSKLKLDDIKDSKSSTSESYNKIDKKVLSIKRNYSLLKEEETRIDPFAVDFLILVEALAVSLMLVDKEITSILLKDKAEKISNEIESRNAAIQIQQGNGENTNVQQELENYVKILGLEKKYATNFKSFFIDNFFNSLVNSNESNDQIDYKKIYSNYVTPLEKYAEKLFKDNSDYIVSFKNFINQKNKKTFNDLVKALDEVSNLKREAEKKFDKSPEEDKIKISSYYRFLQEMNCCQFLKSYVENFIEEIKSNESLLSNANSISKSFDDKNDGFNIKFLSKDCQEIIGECKQFNYESFGNSIMQSEKSLIDLEKKIKTNIDLMSEEVKQLNNKKEEDKSQGTENLSKAEKKNKESGDESGDQQRLGI